MSRNARLPKTVDWLIIHQWDAALRSPGGIDTCIRGFCRYAPANTTFAIVGVDATGDPLRPLGKWEHHEFGNSTVWFMPVVRLDKARARRRIPDSLRVALGAQRYRTRLPSASRVQAHRMDLGLYVLSSLRRPLAYFVHSQSGGIASDHSDSVWRHASATHGRLERRVASRAKSVVVFNPEYATAIQEWNPQTVSSPTWYDPDIFRPAPSRDPHHIVWAGRLEPPKNPTLALRVFEELARSEPEAPWTMTIVGAGTLEDAVNKELGRLSDTLRPRVNLAGRLESEALASVMASGGAFLMTSHSGYEGFSITLIEAMASGLVPVVTEGSDTGRLVTPDVGAVCSRDPSVLAKALRATHDIDRARVCARVEALRADIIVPQVLTAAAA